MTKAVLDTNVVVSGTISPRGIPCKILKAWENNKFAHITSRKIIKEVTKVLHYPKIQKTYHLTEPDIKNVRNSLFYDTQVVEGTYKVKKIKEDPADNKFLEAAIEGKADFIVTGDKHLLRLKDFQGIEIVSPQLFLNILESKR